MNCPDCKHDNIAGADHCERCGTSLIATEEIGNALERGIIGHSVDILCARSPVCVNGKTPVREVMASMLQEKTGCVIVESGGELAGVFSDRDVLNDISQNLTMLDEPVADHMTPSPQTITKDDAIAYAMQEMDLGGYRHLPIVDEDGQPTGIISTRDIVRFLCVRYANSRDAE